MNIPNFEDPSKFETCSLRLGYSCAVPLPAILNCVHLMYYLYHLFIVFPSNIHLVLECLEKIKKVVSGVWLSSTKCKRNSVNRWRFPEFSLFTWILLLSFPNILHSLCLLRFLYDQVARAKMCCLPLIRCAYFINPRSQGGKRCF